MTAGRVDLHLHSTASDGRFRPAALVGRAAALGMSCIALTDHDTIDGIHSALEAARRFPGLRVIPGVEISTDLDKGEAHILGYFIDYTSDTLKAALERFRTSRERRARAMVDKLRNMGIAIEWARVQAIAGDASIGRPHIAQAMLEKGSIRAIQDAFSGYLEHGGPAYVEREKMTPAEAVALIGQADGLPVLAHPFTLNQDPEAMVIELKAAGLVGIEAYYKDNTPQQTEDLLRLAGKYGLIATGGSDYHGLDDTRETAIGEVAVPMAAAEQLIALAKERKLKMSAIIE